MLVVRSSRHDRKSRTLVTQRKAGVEEEEAPRQGRVSLRQGLPQDARRASHANWTGRADAEQAIGESMSGEGHDAELEKLQEQIHKGTEETKTYLASVRLLATACCLLWRCGSLFHES